jgi:hypothetical protein
MAKEEGPLLGSKSFWDMAQLAIAGELASCQSCVEFWYFQSQQNAVAFLDSCAAGGLVERVSLLDLRGDMEPISAAGPTQRQKWYDQYIYISVPAFRKRNLDAARDRIEGTKNAVYEAFQLYHEILRENDTGIGTAYLRAVEQQNLRDSDAAKKRLDVDLSPVAKLRLIRDGYRSSIKVRTRSEGRKLSRSEIDRSATESTVKFVLESADCEPGSSGNVYDHAEELEKFIYEFLGDRRDLAPFWQGDSGSKSRLILLPVISELVHQSVTKLKGDGNVQAADKFEKNVRKAIDQAMKHERKDAPYVAALEEVKEELDSFNSSAHPVPVTTQYGTELRP